MRLVWRVLLAVFAIPAGAEHAADFCRNCSRAEAEHWVRHFVAEPPLFQEMIRQQVSALESAEYVDCDNRERLERVTRRLALDASRAAPPGVPAYSPIVIDPHLLVQDFLTRYRPFREAVNAFYRAAERHTLHHAALTELQSAIEEEEEAARGDDLEEQARATARRSALEQALQPTGVASGMRDLAGPLRAIEESLVGIFPRGEKQYLTSLASADLSFSRLTLWQVARMRVELRLPPPRPHQAIVICGTRDFAHTGEERVSFYGRFLHTVALGGSSFRSEPRPGRNPR